MLKRFRVRNYKALRDVTFEPTRFHVLIGQNETGKTSLFEALEAVSRSVSARLPDCFQGAWDGQELVSHGGESSEVSFELDWSADGGADLRYVLDVRFPKSGRNVARSRELVGRASEMQDVGTGGRTTSLCQVANNSQEHVVDAATLAGELGSINAYRLDPRMLALPTVIDASRGMRIERSGFGLPQLLDELLGRDRRAFDRLEAAFIEAFPRVKSIKMKYVGAFRARLPADATVELFDRADGKGIFFEFTGSELDVPASQVSDGFLILLAVLALVHSPEPPRVLLIEEPENGIHPQRVKEVLRMLRGLVEARDDVQVIMTTHSPDVLDEFEPEEVTLCYRTDAGVKLRKLSESSVVQRQKDIFSLGEIWAAEGDEALQDDAAPVEDETAGAVAETPDA